MGEIDYTYSQGIINLQPNTQEGDEIPVGDGNLYFNGGMVSNNRASKLSNTQFSEGINFDIDQLGQVTTRRGVALQGVSPTGSSIQGLGYFDTPSFEYLLEVANTKLYRFDGSAWSAAISGYTANSASLKIDFAQLINFMYFVDGNGPAQRYDGTSITSGTASWGVTTVPPNGCSGICTHQNRLIVWGDPSNPQYLYISDIISSNFASTNLVQVGTGDGDNIIGCLSWISDQLLVFKERSIYVADTSQGVGSSAALQRIHNTVGCVSKRTIKQIGADKVGQDVFFLARDGVRSVLTTIQDGQQGITPPISYPINDWIQRINWGVASTSNAVYWNNRYLIALPIDSASTPNYVFVYHTINQSWSGYWLGWTPKIFCITGFAENPHLTFGDASGNVMQWLDYVPLTGETEVDYKDNGVDISSSITTKAYNFSQFQNNKIGHNVECEFFDSEAAINLYVNMDGSGPIQSISNFDSSLDPGFMVPFSVPLVIAAGGVRRASNDLLQYGEFREIQLTVSSTSGKVALKTINLLAFLRLPQTIYGN